MPRRRPCPPLHSHAGLLVLRHRGDVERAREKASKVDFSTKMSEVQRSWSPPPICKQMPGCAVPPLGRSAQGHSGSASHNPAACAARPATTRLLQPRRPIGRAAAPRPGTCGGGAGAERGRGGGEIFTPYGKLYQYVNHSCQLYYCCEERNRWHGE